MKTSRIIVGDCVESMDALPAGSVHCVVTSPPYWGLRDYGIEGQLGLESTPSEYLAKMLVVFRAVKRVLRDDATLWLNLGDSYVSDGGGPHGYEDGRRNRAERLRGGSDPALKAKDLAGMPWRLAFALQADGWYLRSDIIWAKPNPMPESCTDRPTKSHEYVFLLTKGQSRERTIAFSDIVAEFVHFGKDFGFKSSYSWSSRLCIDLASALFYAAQRQHDYGLPPFYSEEWKKGQNGGTRDFVAGLPPLQRMAAHASGFLNSDVTTKEFLRELNRLWCDLGEVNPFLVAGGLPAIGDAPNVFMNGDTSITVNDAGKVRKVDVLHARILDTVHTGCNYYYDAEAVREGAEYGRRNHSAEWRSGVQNRDGHRSGGGSVTGADPSAGRNGRTVWTIPTQSFSEAHFATYPERLVEPCIMAGTSDKGCCPNCGAPWVRVVESERVATRPGIANVNDPTGMANRDAGRHVTTTRTTGWRPGCHCVEPDRYCDDARDLIECDPAPCTVLDPFCGSGTTGVVARALGRSFIGLELKAEYAAMAERRIANPHPEPEVPDVPGQIALFDEEAPA